MSKADRFITKAKREARRHAPSLSVARLKELAKVNNAKSYLEIGVADGKTFLHTDFDLKHAVDPKFRFDTRQHESKNCKFFETTSDDFFLYFANPEVKYDVIFLDGLHTFEQTFRDFCSTQAHCHDRTIWLIDDVYPSDAFSAIPSEALSRKFRKLQRGSGKGPWHGDVFKMMFAIHDFFPNLSYRTVVGHGNPQAVVVRRPRKEFNPRFGSLETISRLSYFDFLEEQALLDFATNEEVSAWLTG
ncbi:MAG: class I SAM-dependent methyltransferase [Nitrospiraceae bacterium]